MYQVPPRHFRTWVSVARPELPGGYGIIPIWVAVSDPIWRQRVQDYEQGNELAEFNEQVAAYMSNPYWREIVDEKASWYRGQRKRVRAMFDRIFPADCRDYLLLDEFCDPTRNA
jgi:hypothetical protein